MMKKLVNIDISVFWFYAYIGYIGDVLADILTQNISRLKMIKTYKNIK